MHHQEEEEAPQPGFKRFKITETRNGSIFATNAQDLATTEAEEEDEPVKFEELRKDVIKPDSPCWGCINRLAHGSDNPRIVKLFVLYKTSKGLMSTEELCKQLYKQKKILFPGGPTEEEPSNIEWPLSMVKVHVTAHMQDLVSKLHAQQEEMTVMKEKIKNCVFFKTKKTKNLNMDVEMFKAFVLAETREIQIAKELQNARRG